MSARALLKAVEARLRSAAVLDDPDGKVCGVRPDGQPPQNCGQWYYAVWWNGARDRQEVTTADQVDLAHEVTVTITARMGHVPQDRTGLRLTTDAELIDRAEALLAPGVVHGNYADVVNAANALIPGTAEYAAARGGGVTTNGFVEPLQAVGYGPVADRPASWVGGKAGSDGVLSIDVRFGKARRVRV